MEEVPLALGGRPKSRPSVPQSSVEEWSGPKTPTTLGHTVGERGNASIIQRSPRMVAGVVAGLFAVAGVVSALALRGSGRTDDPKPARAPVVTAGPAPTPPSPTGEPTPPPTAPVAPPPTAPVAPSPVVVAQPPPPPTVEPPPPPPVEVPRQVILKIRSTPAGAEVFLAGAKVGVTPLDYSTTAEQGSLTFELKLAGYVTKRLNLSTDADGEQSVRLAAAPRSKPSHDTLDPFSQ
jgi:hypothetical protein